MPHTDMELHSVHKILYSNHLGEEKQQMLNLNRRLETYLSRVKLLEEENELLANEIKALRHNNQTALVHKKGLDEELQQARLEVDAAWRERVLTELEVEKIHEEIQDLELERQREVQAKVTAKTKLEQSRKELQEEQRAQIWLREKVSQLEHEIKLLIQTHGEDVAYLEATLTQTRADAPPKLVQRVNQTPDLLRMGHEFSQRATRAWQEAAEAYQGQLARLEESLDQARSRLNQVCQEKHESQLMLQDLEKETVSAQDVRQHLEKTVAQRREEHCQQVQQIQMHLENLEAEKEDLTQQIDHLLQENRGLMQLKMSLGLEVATYRALLDRESLGADGILSKRPRNNSVRDVVLSPHGVKRNYQTQLSPGLKTTFPLSVYGLTRSSVTATDNRSRKPLILNETPKISTKPAEMGVIKSYMLGSTNPKIVQDAAENFRPQEVQEKVTCAEPLSPPDEQEAPTNIPEEKAEEEWNIADAEPTEEETLTESIVSQKDESGLISELPLDDEDSLFTTPALTLNDFQVTEKPCNVSGELGKVVAVRREDEKEDVMLEVQADASLETHRVHGEVEEHEETSDSETEAMLEPAFESRPNSLEPESEPAESVLNQVTDENISNEEAAGMKQEVSSSVVETNRKEVEDKLYPDGEEMDTWDSVIERKVSVGTEDVQNEEKTQHAEPEEDISAKEPEGEIRAAYQIGNMTPSVTLPQADDGQHVTLDQGHLPDKEKEDDEEDSQNMSLSWRTELESDSYAQENTLADTRPLIRYKSDDTDANTQASHIDESESSEGEQEKKMEEAGIGTWSDGKSKTFGTMEDLCEEVEEEIDEEYNLGYTHGEDRDVSQSTTGSEHVTLVDGENTEEMLMKVSEERSEKYTEEPTAFGNTDGDYDKELETDRLVEQELENLSTDSYSVKFAQQQTREEMLEMESDCVEEVNEQVEAEKAELGDMFYCEPGLSRDPEHTSSAVDHELDNQNFRDPYSVMFPTNAVAEEEVQQKDHKHEDQDKPEKEEEEGEHNISKVPRTDVTEGHSDFTDFINRHEMEDVEETNHTLDPDSVLLGKADEKNFQDAVDAPEITEALPEKTLRDSQEYVAEDAEDFQKLPDPAESAEWEVLESPTQEKHDQNYENIPEAADEDVVIHREETVEMFPDSVPSEKDIFMVKDVTDSSLHDLFPREEYKDFWVSSLESGATYEPENPSKRAAEQTNPNQGFVDNQVCENLENPYVVNGNSKPDVESFKAITAMKESERMDTEVKTVLVYSEDSEAEAESWSSGEEPV